MPQDTPEENPDSSNDKPSKKRPIPDVDLSVKKKSDSISFRSMRSEKKEPASYDALFDYVKENTKDTIAYVLMVIGLLLMLFGVYWGDFLIGVIFSLYFVNEITFALTHTKEFIEEYGLVKSLVLAGTLLGIFFKVPFMFLGIAIVAVIRMFVWPEGKV